MSATIIRLPTAASHIVRNPTRAARAFRAEHQRWPRSEYVQPESLTAVLDRAAQRSPEMLIALAIFKALPDDVRSRAQDVVHAIHCAAPTPETRLADMLVARIRT